MEKNDNHKFNRYIIFDRITNGVLMMCPDENLSETNLYKAGTWLSRGDTIEISLIMNINIDKTDVNYSFGKMSENVSADYNESFEGLKFIANKDKLLIIDTTNIDQQTPTTEIYRLVHGEPIVIYRSK